MSTFPEEVQENVALNHQGTDGGIVGKQWEKFDYDPREYEHYEICGFNKSPNGSFITFRICFG